MRLLIARMTVLLLGLPLLLGATPCSVQAATGSNMMGGKVVIVPLSTDMSGSGDCIGHGGRSRMIPGACSTACAALVAVLPIPASALDTAAVHINSTAPTFRDGLSLPPDLPPPRRATLG